MLRSIVLGLLCLLPAAAVQAQDQIFKSALEDGEVATSGTGCEGVEQTGLLLFPLPWGGLFPGQSWPRPLGNFRPVTVQNSGVVSIPIQLGNDFTGEVGRFETAEASGMPTGPLAISISRCPGDFRPAELNNSQRGCLVWGTSAPSLLWVRNGAPHWSYCPLEVGTAYWINIAWISVPPTSPATSTCPGLDNCTTLVGNRELTEAEFESYLRALTD